MEENTHSSNPPGLGTGSGDGNYAFPYTENDPATVVVDATIDLQDVDHTNLASATVTLTNGQVGDILEFGAMPAGITAVAVPATALTVPGTITVTLSGSATLADYEARGMPVAMSGRVASSGMRFSYVDARSNLNCMMELVDSPGGTSTLWAPLRQATDEWDGKTDPIRIMSL